MIVWPRDLLAGECHAATRTQLGAGLLAGMIGGLIRTIVMTEFQKGWTNWLGSAAAIAAEIALPEVAQQVPEAQASGPRWLPKPQSFLQQRRR